VGFYEGPNFKLTKSSKEHSGFVNCNKFSPDGKHILSVSSDKVHIFIFYNNQLEYSHLWSWEIRKS